jgi:hypothetical protein
MNIMRGVLVAGLRFELLAQLLLDARQVALADAERLHDLLEAWEALVLGAMWLCSERA